MKNNQTSSRTRAGTPRAGGFAWSIRSEDIPFMRPGPAEAGVDASAGCINDCGGITRLPVPRQRKSGQRVQ
jgi:hypothetical protein